MIWTSMELCKKTAGDQMEKSDTLPSHEIKKGLSQRLTTVTLFDHFWISIFMLLHYRHIIQYIKKEMRVIYFKMSHAWARWVVSTSNLSTKKQYWNKYKILIYFILGVYFYIYLSHVIHALGEQSCLLRLWRGNYQLSMQLQMTCMQSFFSLHYNNN